MKLKIFSAAFIIGTTLSCKKDMKPTYIEGAETTEAANAPTNGANPTALAPNQNVGPVSTTPVAAQNMQIRPQGVQATAPGTNPPHGQPGHRCDLAVGAPLNSPPGKTQANTQQMTINPSTMKQAPLAASTGPKPTTAKGMNPPHGEPGHRCDIPVGTPLNSPPGKNPSAPASTVQTTPAPTSTAASIPATIAAPQNTTTSPEQNK